VTRRSTPGSSGGGRPANGSADGARLLAISFDFANTLVPVDRRGFRTVVELTLDAATERCRIRDRDAFLRAWDEERDRQFREEVPEGREVDLAQRVGRVLARCRGFVPPPVEERWDDVAALALSSAEERDLVVDRYTSSFVHAMPPPPMVGPLLARLAARGFRLGILSNWPLSVTIERYVEAAGWRGSLAAIVVSQRVGAIKPSPVIFATAAAELGVAGPTILHVGDDWMADVVGARRAGWRACFLRNQAADWPRQAVDPADPQVADVTIDHLDELEAALEGFTGPG
jgi:HAD superfamily hydrolase (TIGR01509 family)